MKLSKNVSLIRANGMAFLAHHDILGQLAREMISGLPGDFRPQRRLVWIMVGVHYKMKIEWSLPGYKIAIQTEQLTDVSGQEPWVISSALDRVGKIRRSLAGADLFLDLSAANAPFYDQLDIPEKDRAKLRFGPYVFPSMAPRL